MQSPDLPPVPSLRHALAEDLRVLGAQSRGIIGILRGLVGRGGFSAVFLYRIAAWGVRHRGFIGRVVSVLAARMNNILNGCDINPRATLGAGLRMPHPVGVVIGHGVVTGVDVTLMSGVVLGLRDPSHDEETYRNYPMVGDGVFIGAGAVLIGGVTIGARACIGANAVVMHDVPDAALAVGLPARCVARTHAGKEQA